MNNPNYIQGQWEGFASAIGLDETCEIQHREMRRAFFAGALSLLRIQMGGIDHSTDPEIVSKGDIVLMEYISAEMDAYREDLKDGRA